MNYKLLIVFSLFLILGSISAVSAENVSNDTMIEDNVQVFDDVVINNFTGLDDTIADANPNNVIDLKSDIIKNENEFDNYRNGITIDKNITINGNGYTIDANNNGRIFIVENGATLILNNISLINGDATDIGFGAFNCNGGAIYNTEGSTLIVDSIVFKNNVAQIGGAIDNGGNMHITDSTFINNAAFPWGQGGAIESFGYDAESEIYDSVFIINSADDGGAIYFSAGKMLISGCLFEDNIANYSGAIDNAGWDAELVIEDSTFINNQAITGGAIGVDGTDTYIRGTNLFINNSATDSGGAIFTQYGYSLYISGNNSFINNSAVNTGGAIYNDVYSDIYWNGSSYFEGNSAENGGAIYNGGFIDNIANATFINNNASYGGAICNFDGSEGNANIENIENSIFENNNASAYGGAIYNGDIIGNITDSTFNNNVAWDNGAIFNDGEISTPIDVNIIANSNTVKAGENITFIATATISNGTLTGGNVVFKINGKEYTAIQMPDGSFVYTYTTESMGTVTANATYENVTSKDITVTVTKADPTFEFNVTHENNITSVEIETNVIDGEILVVLDNKHYEIVSIVDGVVKLEYADLTEGIHKILVVFNGNDQFNAYSETVRLTDLVNTHIVANNLTKYYLNNDSFSVILVDEFNNPIANQIVSLTINGVDYYKLTNENGIATLNINLNPGIYQIFISYEGSEDYNISSAEFIVTVLSTISGDNVVKFFKNDSQYSVLVVDNEGNPLVNVNVTFNINGVFYTRTSDENGIATLNINLNPGNYIVSALNSVTGEITSNNITVLSTLVENSDIVKYFRNDTQYSVKVLDNNGNPLVNVNVTFNINGVFYTRTSDENGIATLNINLNPGEYIITAEYNNLMVSNKITVLPILSASDLNMNYQDGSTFNCTLVDNQGNPLANKNVTFNVNGIFYNRITDADGVARLNINLNPGEYIITSMYGGSATSNKINISI